MRIEFFGGEISGKITAPPSKSHTHRALFLSAMSGGPCTIYEPLICDDTLSTASVIGRMGVSVRIGRNVTVDGTLSAPSNALYAGNSGTTMRFATTIASLFDSPVTIDGDDSLRKRPMQPLLDSLSGMGVECTSSNGSAPLTIRGPNAGGKASVSGKVSSQFVSSLLMAAPMFTDGVELSVDGLVSKHYVDTTIEMMRAFGADVDIDGGYRVSPGKYAPSSYHIPGDASSAAFLFAAGALGGKVTVRGLEDDPDSDLKLLDILEVSGSDVSFKRGDIRITSNELHAVNADLSNNPDLFPVVAVLMSVAEGTSRISGLSHLRFKETDRLSAVTEMINTLGGDASIEGDDCIICGQEYLKGGEIDAKGDHRIMMAAAVASLVCESSVIMDGCECCSISYPDFLKDMDKIGLEMEVI